MAQEFERGNAPLRVEWTYESTEGVVRRDPGTRSYTWNAFSDNIRSAWGWEPDANTQRQDAAGETFAQGFFNGSETHEINFEYDLQQWFIDGSDLTLDPHGDFLRASSDNALRTTHTIVSRSRYDSGGNGAGLGYRVHTVAKGCHPDSSTIPYETEDGAPIQVTPSWQAEKVRRYVFHQPSDGTLTVESTDAGDTTQTIHLEDDGASTSESVALNGTNQVSTANNYTSLDAAELDAETAGDVIIKDGSGNEIVRIRGQNSYPAAEGDLGVPTTDGNHAGAIGSEYISFLDDSLDIPNLPASPNISDAGLEVVSGELSVDTGLNDNAQAGDTARRNIHSEAFEFVFTASLAGEHVHVDQAINYLTEQSGDLTWNAQEGSVSGTVRITSPGEYTKEADTAKLVADNEFEVVGSLTITDA